VVKNNHIVTQTWGVLVTHMYFPIEVSFSLEDKYTEENVEIGYTLAKEKAYEVFDGIVIHPSYQYTFDLELEN
jgi:hypothetical protein